MLDPASADPAIQGPRRFLAHLASQPRLTATALQDVGSKGYDGLAIGLVIADA